MSLPSRTEPSIKGQNAYLFYDTLDARPGFQVTDPTHGELMGYGLNLAAILNSVGGLTGLQVAKVALAAVDTAGGLFAWQAPLDCIVQRVIIDLTTRANGACTADIGETATNATTSSNNLLTGLDLRAAIGTFDNLQNPGASGKPLQKTPSGKWITGSVASGASVGLVGFAYIEYIPV